MKVIIDTHEKQSRQEAVKTIYETKYDTDVTVERLEYGDYLFDNKVVFEYKTVHDFIASINNGSVFDEASNQTTHYPFSYVIISGDFMKEVKSLYYKNKNNRYKYKLHEYIERENAKYIGAIRRLRCICNVITVSNEIAAVTEMIEQSIKCLDHREHTGVVRKVQTENPAVTFLTCISGISVKKAKNIVETLDVKTLTDLTRITKEELLTVQGIGEKTAEKVVDYL